MRKAIFKCSLDEIVAMLIFRVKMYISPTWIEFSSKTKFVSVFEVNCETDFVARNEDFKNFVHEVALQIAQSSTQDVDSLLKEEYFRNPEQTINDLLRDIIVKTGENIRIKRFSRFILGG